MQLKTAFGAVAAALLLGLVGAPAAAAAPAGGLDGGCRATADMDRLGRPEVTSACKGRFPSGAAHRAVITCDTVQGVREHVVRRTYRSKWAPTGSKAKVGCGFKSFLVGFATEVKGA
ncbi:hypothetical protein Slala03_34080 [Streptomyces lavendulae subsp. lavendulae]|uniref:hypothetical protein n=1 Tax=Streptomyces lavendulae TaxID=1914 RepID=UPI0024A1BF06|nr:hypothetical protein [Streptomyces lavendulae]GLV83719.1 hypothetical protein Slala03_34080 [Streptomyces lavendulae subsp. lavendulae]